MAVIDVNVSAITVQQNTGVGETISEYQFKLQPEAGKTITINEGVIAPFMITFKLTGDAVTEYTLAQNITGTTGGIIITNAEPFTVPGTYGAPIGETVDTTTNTPIAVIYNATETTA